MRLGGPVWHDEGDAEGWVSALRDRQYGAAVFPLKHTAGDDIVDRYVAAAETAGIVIGEVGAWSNPISLDDGRRREAIAFCQAQLALADRVGARCCVNIAGSRSEQWDGPDADNLSDETFDLIVETTREIIDAVKPTRTYFALEAMPWVFPDSPESYLRLIEAIGRERFAVHLDPANMINSPERYFRNADFIRECFRLLGPHIRSCHAKDSLMSTSLTVHIDEARPGLGVLDYGVFLRETNRLDPDTPIILEHLPNAEEYDLAAAYVRAVAEREGLAFVQG